MMTCSAIVVERQHHGKRRVRFDLLTGMRIKALTIIADDSRTMLSCGLATTRTDDVSVISALPLTFYRKVLSLRTPRPVLRGHEMLSRTESRIRGAVQFALCCECAS